MEREFPRVIDSAIYFGHLGFYLDRSDLDSLIEVLGEPEACFVLEDDLRFQIFSFDHALGKIHAFLYFREPDANPTYFVEIDNDLDRGFLVEVQVELIEPLHLSKYGRPISILENQKYKFAVFSKMCLVRMISRRRFDCISFLNSNSITKPKNSFLYQRIWPIEKPIGDLRQLVENERSRKMTADLARQSGLITPINLQGPTKK